MIADFERSKQDVRGHSVMITSWFDNSSGSWRASAPAYAYLLSQRAATANGYSSRKSAIDRVVALLSSHFDRPVH